MTPLMTPPPVTESDAQEVTTPANALKPKKQWILRAGEFLILLVIAIFVLETFSNSLASVNRNF